MKIVEDSGKQKVMELPTHFLQYLPSTFAEDLHRSGHA